MRIQMARAGDSSAIVTLLGEQFREHGIDRTPESLSGAVEGLLSDAGRGAILLAHDPEPLGLAVLAYTCHGTSASSWPNRWPAMYCQPILAPSK